MDPGYIVIAIFVGILALILWPVGIFRNNTYDDSTKTQPGRRLEGAMLTSRNDNDSDGGGAAGE